MEEEKAKSLFYNSVNKKKEPYVCSMWVAKINHKGQYDQRFFIATYSQFYLCKRSIFGGSISISREYPWVTLKSITSKRNNQLTFVFQKGCVTIETKKLDSICKDLSLLFYELFPQEFRANFNLPLQRPFIPPTQIRHVFCGLFISFCHSFDYSVSDSYFKKLCKSLKNHPKVLDFTEIPSDKKMFKALFKSLELTQNIRYLTISECWHYNLFESLSTLMKANKYLEGIEFRDVKKTSGFDKFIGELDSKLTSLRFSKFRFTPQNFKSLICSVQMHYLEEIKFSECDLDEKKIMLFLKLSDKFENLNKIIINHNYNAFTKNVISSMFNINNNITKIELKNANINIRDFFSAISKSDTVIQKINLSLNIFTSVTNPTTRKIAEPFIFPPTLKELILREVKWETDSLLYMLSEQEFNSPCTVDYSGLTLFNDEWNTFHTYVEKLQEPINPPTEIIWNDNNLDARLIMFISKIKQLNKVDFSGCYYDSEKMVSILNALVVLVQTLNISSFSLGGSKKCTHAPLIFELLPIMSTRNIIASLNIPNNALGNQGLEVLQRFVEQNLHLNELSFDGSLPTQVQPFINLMESIKQSKSITELTYPKNDVEQLIRLFPESKDLILSSSDAAISNVNSNRDDQIEIQETNLFMSIGDMFSERKNENEEMLRTSWKVEYNLPENQGKMEWDAMQKKFTILNLFNNF